MQPIFENVRIKSVLINGLRDAQNKVEVAMAWFTDRDLFDELVSCAGRGIKVCLLLYDDDINRDCGIDWTRLVAGGGFLYWYNPVKGTMHHKFCVVDDRHCFFGTYNWTNAALTWNNESLLVLDSKDTASSFSDEINKLLSSPLATPHAGGGTYYSTLDIVAHSGLEQLRREIMLLELEIAELEGQISELEAKLYKYEAILRAHLADLLLEQLSLQQELALRRAKMTMKRVYEEEAKRWQAKYEETKSSIDEAKKAEKIELDKDVAADMKRMYREAIFSIHPDKYYDDPERYARATELTQQLIDAFKSSNYQRVKEIWERVKSGWIFDTDILKSDSWEMLTEYLQRQRDKYSLLLIRLNSLLSNEILLAVEIYPEFQDYVEICKLQLMNNINHIKKEIEIIDYE